MQKRPSFTPLALAGPGASTVILGALNDLLAVEASPSMR
jgi:hypothetical protein